MRHFKSDLQPVILLVGVIAIVFGNSLFHQFTYDDHKSVENNIHIETMRYFPLLFSREYFSVYGERSYRPVVTASYFIDHLLWGKRAFGYHLTNLLFHASAAVFFYLLSRYFIEEKKSRLFAAFIFALHPAVCEPVNSISFREDILAGLFVMMTLVICLSRKTPSPPLIAASVISGLLALFSKESAIPLFIILFTFFILKTGKKSDSMDKPRFPFLAAQFLVLLFYIIIRFRFMTPADAWKTRLLGGSASAAAAHSGFLFLKAWITILFPFRLNADYAFHNVKGILTPYSAIGTLFSCLYILVLWRTRKKGLHDLFAGLFWIFIFFLPASNLIPLANPFAERYLYLTLPGFAIIAGIGYEVLQKKFHDKNERKTNIASIIAPSTLLLVLAFLSVNRNLVWSSDKTLWTSTLEREPKSVRALNGVGLVFIGQEKYDKAQELFLKALAIDPLDYEVRNNLAVAYIHSQKPERAIEELEMALEIKPDYATAHYNLGRLYYYDEKQGSEKALRHLNRARELGYPVPESFFNNSPDNRQ